MLADRDRLSPLPAIASQRGEQTSSALGVHVPGIDGLRGVAVLGVLAFHAGLSWARGGFLGVSLFFTLSGFLITGILLRRPRGGLRAFWGRRARRLLPAAFLTLAGVVVFGATVATRQQADALPAQMLGAATWTANWQFILSGQSYVDLFAAPSPVQHFWSLAIEEQFYLVFPLALMLVVRRARSSAVVALTLAGVALISTVWMAVLYWGGASLDRLYYGTDTRIAELLVGAALAVVVASTGTAWSPRIRWMLSIAGLGALVLMIASWTRLELRDGALWRGGFLVLAVLACLVILGVLAGRGPLVALLSLSPLVAVGRISYGLYLYHFPIYLWLTEARTGLGRWPLLALRLLVTTVVAVLSYRFVERPVLAGRSLGLSRWVRVAIVPVAMVLLVVATVVTVDRSGEDPLAAVRAGAAGSTMPSTAPDGVLDILVVPGRAEDPVIRQLVRDAARTTTVRVTVAPGLRCTGGLESIPGGRTCGSWSTSWPRLVARADPDVVLLYVDDWAGTDAAAVLGRPGLDPVSAAAELLSPALDLLASRGAPIVWVSSGTNFAEAIRRSVRPFSAAMALLEARRSDIVRGVGTSYLDPATMSAEQYRTRSAAALLTDASLHQRASAGDLPRVMVVGDSQSLSLGYGLERWAAEHHRAAVWNRGIEACGVAVDGEIRQVGTPDGTASRCRDAAEAWAGQVRSFRPDVVVVFTSLIDTQDRKLPGDRQFRSIGDPVFDDFLVGQYAHAVDVLGSTGARIVWITPPCLATQPEVGQSAAYDTGHISRLRDTIIPALLRARPRRVVTYDLARILCPAGKPRTSVPGVGALRPDGVHFSVEGALWFARTYGDDLLRRGGL